MRLLQGKVELARSIGIGGHDDFQGTPIGRMPAKTESKVDFVLAFIVLLILVLIGGNVLGDSQFHLGGKVFNDSYFSTQNLYGKTFEQESLSAWLQGDAQIEKKYFLRAIYQGDVFEGNNSAITGGFSQTTLRSTLREAYGEYRSDSGSLILRMGKQIISWGKSDGVNPTDYFSARDYSYLNPDDEVRRLAGTGLLTQFVPENGESPWTFNFVVQVLFPQGLALIPSAILPPSVVVGGAPTYAVNFDNSEYAIKTVYGGNGWDGSLSVFRGFNHQEEFALGGFQFAPSGTVINFNKVFRRVTAIGMDASESLTGKWVLRFEGAYIRTENDSASDPESIPSHLDAVAGAERPLGSDFRLAGQILIRYFPNYASLNQVVGPDPITQQINLQLAQANALLLQYQDRTRPSTSLRVAWAPSDSEWSAEMFFIYSFAGGDYLIKPQVNFRPVDNLKLTLGADNYGGDVTKPLGSLKPYNSIFLECKYDF